MQLENLKVSRKKIVVEETVFEIMFTCQRIDIKRRKKITISLNGTKIPEYCCVTIVKPNPVFNGHRSLAGFR